MLHELAIEDFKVIDGHLDVPERPGLGVTVNQEFVDTYRVKN
jgi:L-alanine-DL-glutamate epimerase-like enolase superfamily enzyme